MQLYWIDQKAIKKLGSAVFDKELHPAIDPKSRQPYTGNQFTLKPESLRQASNTTLALDPKTRRQYRLCLTIKQVGPSVVSAQQVIERVPEYHIPLTLGVNNVRLLFPQVGESGAELWTTTELLSSSSPYLKDLLTSDFSEGIKIGIKRSRTSPAPVMQTVDASVQKDFEDSDDDTDIALFKADPPKRHVVQDGDELAYRQITITQAAYSTWRAVLRYLESGFIRFAPLSSASQPKDPSVILTRDEYIQMAQDYDPSVPAPVSPKSTAAHELFDDAAVCYEDWRKAVIDYIVKKGSAVMKTSNWAAIKQRVNDEDVPLAKETLMELVMAQAAAND